MKTAQVAFLIEGEQSSSCNVCDAIFHNGEWWIVPSWISDPLQGRSKPEIAIRLASLSHKPSDSGHYQFVINTPLPKGFFVEPFEVPQEWKLRAITNLEAWVDDAHWNAG